MHRGKLALAGALTIAAVALLIGCEDTPIAPGEDWTMSLIAQPSVVQAGADSELIAIVMDANGVPQAGVSVTFSAAAGLLASGSARVETDDEGRAHDTLTVRAGDPDSIEVSAISGALSATATVEKAEACAANQAPTALIAGPETQTFSGTVGSTVDVPLDGSFSSDLDGVVTTYTWLCGNGEAAVSSDDPAVICTYTFTSQAHDFTASLQVKDSGIGGGPGRPATCIKTSAPDTVKITLNAGTAP